jgi:hypothetical protein
MTHVVVTKESTCYEARIVGSPRYDIGSTRAEAVGNLILRYAEKFPDIKVEFAGLLIAFLLFPALTARAQYRFLGSGSAVPDRRSPLGITYSTDGLELVSSKQLVKSTAKLQALNAPQSLINRLQRFPAQDYGQIIDTAYGTALASFRACGGTIQERAEAFNPNVVRIQFEPTEFQDALAFGDTWLAGETIWSERTVKVTPFYAWAVPGQAQPNAAWLRSTLNYEFGNVIANGIGISAAEPHSVNFPCDQ